MVPEIHWTIYVAGNPVPDLTGEAPRVEKLKSWVRPTLGLTRPTFQHFNSRTLS